MKPFGIQIGPIHHLPLSPGELGLLLSGDDLFSGDFLFFHCGVGEEDGEFLRPFDDLENVGLFCFKLNC